jgi:cytoskeleton protein RodZ
MGGAVAGIGEALRSTREHRGLSIDQVAQDTRISPRFLEALEAEQFNELPAPVYVRGFLRSYANYLKLEPQPLLDRLIGGDVAMPGGAGGYVGGNGRPASRKNDPFQRGGVVTASPAPRTAGVGPIPVPATEPEDDGWAPGPLAPFSLPPADHGYIPGSDLMEAPEQTAYEPYPEPEPIFRSRTPGVLAERPPGPNEPGIPRRVALFGGAVAAVLGFLLLAVFLTRGDDEGTGQAVATGGGTPAVTPGTVIPLGSRTPTQAAAIVTATDSATASVTGTVTASTTPGTPTPQPTPVPGTTVTPTPTASATPTQTPPLSTPTQFVPTPTPTVGPPPHPSTYSACDTTRATEKCGSSYVRVICYPPFAENDPTGKNNNYFVDVSGAYPLQPGWRETTVYAPVSIGPVIEAGRNSCL